MPTDCTGLQKSAASAAFSRPKIDKPVFGIFIFSNENDHWRRLLDQRGFINRPLRSFL